MTATMQGTADGTAAGTIRTGMGGWVYPPWRDNFYPAGLVQKEELAYASRHVTMIEINGTFYRAPSAGTYAGWRAQTPEGFVFSVKAPRYIVEQRTLANAKTGIERFIRGGLAELADRLGPVLWQLSPRRAFDRDDIAAFMDLLPRQLDGQPLRHVLEVRHDSFIDETYLALVRERGIASVFTDSGDYPSFADLSGDLVYARLMRSRSDVASGYPRTALANWAKRAREWAQGGEASGLPYIDPASAVVRRPRDVFIVFISAAKERNPAAALALKSLLAD